MRNHNSLSKCYLAGAINGKTFDQAKDWRNEASEYLIRIGIEPIDPMRFDHFILPDLDVDEVINDQNVTNVPDYFILNKCLDDLKNSNIILVNLSDLGERAYIGTLMELGIGLNENIKTFSFGTPRCFREHPFLRDIVHTDRLEQALGKIALYNMCQ